MVKMLNAAPKGNAALVEWVQNWAELCCPDGVYWCDGSQAEYDRLAEECVASGLAIRLNPEKRPRNIHCQGSEQRRSSEADKAHRRGPYIPSHRGKYKSCKASSFRPRS